MIKDKFPPLLRGFITIGVILIFLSLAIIAIQLAKVNEQTKLVDYHLQPWQHLKPQASFKVLFAGDSTAVGTGLEDNALSTSGRLSLATPNPALGGSKNRCSKGNVD